MCVCVCVYYVPNTHFCSILALLESFRSNYGDVITMRPLPPQQPTEHPIPPNRRITRSSSYDTLLGHSNGILLSTTNEQDPRAEYLSSNMSTSPLTDISSPPTMTGVVRQQYGTWSQFDSQSCQWIPNTSLLTFHPEQSTSIVRDDQSSGVSSLTARGRNATERQLEGHCLHTNRTFESFNSSCSPNTLRIAISQHISPDSPVMSANRQPRSP